MLLEVFEIVVFKDNHEGVTYNPPMIMGTVKLEKFPSVDEIESAIRELEGNTAKIDKRYKLN